MAKVSKKIENKARELAQKHIDTIEYGGGGFSSSSWVDARWDEFVPKAKKALKIK